MQCPALVKQNNDVQIMLCMYCVCVVVPAPPNKFALNINAEANSSYTVETESRQIFV